MKTELRLAAVPNLAELQPLVRDYHAFEGIASTAAQRESALRRLLSDPDLGGIWLVMVDGALAGYIALCRGFSLEFNGFDAFIDEFYLHPSYRGRGVGREVLDVIRLEARERGIGAIHLEVARDNQRARKLYAAAGFESRDRYLLMSAKLGEE